MSRLSIIVPALDEAAGIAACLAPLQPMRARGGEGIVVDGGSGDDTVSGGRPLAGGAVVVCGAAAWRRAGGPRR